MNNDKEEETEKTVKTIDIETLENEGFEFTSGESIKLIITEPDEGLS